MACPPEWAADQGVTIAQATEIAVQARLRRVGVAAACVPIGIGLVALLGWASGLSALTQFFSARSAMQPITALCAML